MADASLSASSSYATLTPERARLNMPSDPTIPETGSWSPNHVADGEWIQVCIHVVADREMEGAVKFVHNWPSRFDQH